MGAVYIDPRWEGGLDHPLKLATGTEAFTGPSLSSPAGPTPLIPVNFMTQFNLSSGQLHTAAYCLQLAFREIFPIAGRSVRWSFTLPFAAWSKSENEYIHAVDGELAIRPKYVGRQVPRSQASWRFFTAKRNQPLDALLEQIPNLIPIRKAFIWARRLSRDVQKRVTIANLDETRFAQVVEGIAKAIWTDPERLLTEEVQGSVFSRSTKVSARIDPPSLRSLDELVEQLNPRKGGRPPKKHLYEMRRLARELRALGHSWEKVTKSINEKHGTDYKTTTVEAWERDAEKRAKKSPSKSVKKVSPGFAR